MWKKDEAPSAQPTAQGAARTPAPRSGGSGGMATIGPSITIRGDVTGSEDLLIQGNVEGSVSLEKHAVSVGPEGRIKADIKGRVITVEGRVEGDLDAKEQIVLRGSAHVLGDLKAPRLVLEDGATFRGLVDMTASSPTSGAERAPHRESNAPAAKGSAVKTEEPAPAGAKA